jgi:hypothetical protein
LINGEVNDEETLNEILKNIAKIARSQPISNGQRLHVHYLLHYLKIKNIKFSFPFQIFREFNEVCRTFEEDGTFSKTVAIELDEKSRR